MTQVHDIYNTINLHSLTYRKLFMQSRLSSLSKQKGMIKDDFNVSWYEVSATNTSLFDRSIVPVCPFNSLQSQMSSIFWNGWDPAGILKNLTPELVRFSQSTTQQTPSMFVNIGSLGWVRAQLGVRKMARLIDRHIVSRRNRQAL